MPTIQGSGGSVQLPGGFYAKLNRWTAELTASTIETTGFADQGYRTFEPVALSLTGTASGTAQAGTNPSTPIASGLLDTPPDLAYAKGQITLQATQGCSYSFDGIMQKMALDRLADGRCDIAFHFQATGPITQTWDEPPPPPQE